MSEIFLQLSVVLGIAVVLSLIMKLLRQPLIIGYVLTGIIVGPAVLNLINSEGNLTSFSHIGVALLLFIVGLGLKPRMIKEIGKVAVIAGFAQIIITTFFGFLIARMFGLAPVVSFYVGIALAFSSTIIILRVLYNKQEQDSLYGRISIGILLLQDAVALLLFLILPSAVKIGSGDFLSVIGLMILKIVAVCLIVYLLIKFAVPRVDKVFADNRELLFLFSIGVCFVFAALFYELQFSMELGALAAGVMLSVSPSQREIASRLSSLRDFFLIIFFIVLGANVYSSDIVANFKFIAIFTLFVLIGEPIIMFFIMRFLKYTIKTSLFTGLITAQISEFSLILIGLGIGLGQVPASVLGPITIVGIITIAISSYFVSYNAQIYNALRKPLRAFFSDKFSRTEIEERANGFEVVLFGCHRMGWGLMKSMRRLKIKFLVVDHDPETIKKLSLKKIPCLFGSADDVSMLESLPLKHCRLIISTISEVDTSGVLISFMKKIRRNNVICVTNHHYEAEKLYKLGAAFVIIPPYLGRRFMADLFAKNRLNAKKYFLEKRKHLAYLKELDKEKAA
ncbi:MAG: cation:proton antiporter [Parcubacteria group bacterium]